MIRIKRILCALDLNKSFTSTLEYAIYLAWTQGSKLFLLSSVENDRNLAPVTSADMKEKLERDAMSCLSSYVIHTDVGPELDIDIRKGSGIMDILEKATKEKIDLIVIGEDNGNTQEHIASKKMIEQLFEDAPCPVLVSKAAA